MKILGLLSVALCGTQLYAQTGLRGFELEYAPEAEAFKDNFGKSVSALGDVNGDRHDDYMIGADFADGNGLEDAGTVFVYSGATGEVLYHLSGGKSSDKFGGAISRSEDVDGDQIPDFVVGARSANSANAGSAGMVYVFSGVDGTKIFSFQGTITNSFFGIDVAGVGDTNLDGIPDFLVGSRGVPSSSGTSPGHVHLYSGADGLLIRKIDGPTNGDSFGDSIAALGDVDLDGAADFLVGAPGIMTTFIYSGLTGEIIRQFDDFPFGSDAGYDVASAGDLTGDSIPEILIGEPSARKVHIFDSSNGMFLGNFEGAFDLPTFGSAVCSVGDIDQDGYPDVLIGAYEAIPNGPKTGAALLYSTATGQILKQFDGNVDKEKYGSSVAYAGDVNRDGLPDFLIGARQGDVSGLGTAGFAELYRPTFYLTLAIDGAVPETLLVSASYANGGDLIGIFIGQPGSSISSFATCTDLAFEMDMAIPDRFYQSGPTGQVSFLRKVPASAIGWVVQAVNMTTCEVSNSITL